MRGKTVVWARYPSTLPDGTQLTKETVCEYASSLLSKLITEIHASGEKQLSQIVAVKIVEDAHLPDCGVILAHLAEVPESAKEHTWNGAFVLARTWDPRVHPEHHDVTFVSYETKVHFKMSNREDADMLVESLKRVLNFYVEE